MIIGLVLTWVAVLVLCWLGWQLLRQNGRILLRLEALEQHLDELDSPPELEGLPVGTLAPKFDLPDLTGERRTLAQFRTQPLLVVFFNPDCGFCRDMAPKLAALTRPADTLSHPMGEGRGEGGPLVLVITTGDAEKNRPFFREHKIPGPVLLQKDSEVATAYQANGTPTGYLINTEGEIASKLAAGAEALLALANEPRSSRREEAHSAASRASTGDAQSQKQSLVTSAATAAGEEERARRFGHRSLARSKIARNGLKAGTPAPLFRLPRLDGGELALEDLRGSRVLLVFSDPRCGPCEALAPQLEQAHRELPELRVVMISRGDPKENRAKVKAHALTFPVVLQKHWEISRRYAMFATPIAYLVNEAGTVTHDVAVGEDAIRNLLSEVRSPAADTDLSPSRV